MNARQQPTIRSTTRRGFTLVELMIVGGLLVLFAGLAIYGVHRAYEDGQRKAIISETRQIATALDHAYADLGFFPALCFLETSLQSYMTMYANMPLAMGESPRRPPVRPDGGDVMEYMGTYLTATGNRAVTMQVNWSPSGYLSLAQGLRDRRSGTSRNTRPMVLAHGAIGYIGTFEWPTDAYDNPYMVYDLNLVPDQGNAVVLNMRNSFRPGDFVTAVVSYGRNGVPGGLPNAQGGELDGDELRLYCYDSEIHEEHLVYKEDALRIWASNFGGAWSASLPNAPHQLMSKNPKTNDPIGITDPGSDDIVFTF